jgi:hypothetical protein
MGLAGNWFSRPTKIIPRILVSGPLPELFLAYRDLYIHGTPFASLAAFPIIEIWSTACQQNGLSDKAPGSATPRITAFVIIQIEF